MDFSVVSTKGRPMMHYKTKLFTKSKETRSADGLKSKFYWSCSKRGCRGSVNYARTIDQDNPESEGIYSDIVEREHNDLCTTTSFDIIHRIARSEIIKQAATGASLGTVRAAVLDPLLLLYPTAGQTMQTAVNLQSSYSRAARAALPPLSSAGLMTQPFPVQFQTTIATEQFLMFQENFASTPDGVNDSTILVFCTVPFFTAFCAVKTIFIDGTFNIAPTGFSRYLSLLSTQGTYGRFIPAMHCLLTGCTEDFYSRLFALIKSKAAEMQIEIQWETVVADYDPILVNAFRVCFPLVEMQGCHFHFIAAVYKVAYSLLKDAFGEEASGVRVAVKKVFALAFLDPLMPSTTPLDGLREGEGEAVLDCVWGMVKAEILNLHSPLIPEGALQSFVDYFEVSWMGAHCRGQWSVHGLADQRETNDLEAWHAAMNLSLHRKDTLWKAVPALKDEQHAREADELKIGLGTDGPPQRRFRKQKEEAITAATAEHSMGSISSLEYVNRVAYRMGH